MPLAYVRKKTNYASVYSVIYLYTYIYMCACISDYIEIIYPHNSVKSTGFREGMDRL